MPRREDGTFPYLPAKLICARIYLTRPFLSERLVPGRPDVTVIEWIASGNDGHLFRAHSTELGRDVACKIIPRNNLHNGPDGSEMWRAEILKANALRNPIVVKVEHISDWPNVAKQGDVEKLEVVDCIALISEFVDGQCLKSFAAEYPDEITVSFIVQWLSTMLNLFFEMKQRGVNHGDLHAGNILVEDQSSYNVMGPRFVFRVTDFGVGDTTSEPRFKDDFLQLADTLAQLLRTVNYQACGPKDKFVFNISSPPFSCSPLGRNRPDFGSFGEAAARPVLPAPGVGRRI